MNYVKARIVITFFLAGSLLLFTECKRDVAFIDPHFIGIWLGNEGGSSYRLSIDQHSNAYWTKNTGSNYESAQGIARERNNWLHIGLRRFYINQYPQGDSLGNWTMVLDGILYSE